MPEQQGGELVSVIDRKLVLVFGWWTKRLRGNSTFLHEAGMSLTKEAGFRHYAGIETWEAPNCIMQFGPVVERFIVLDWC